MKYIPVMVIKVILDRCYADNPEMFINGMMNTEVFFIGQLVEVVEKTINNDLPFRYWALNELTGVSHDGDTE